MTFIDIFKNIISTVFVNRALYIHIARNCERDRLACANRTTGLQNINMITFGAILRKNAWK